MEINPEEFRQRYAELSDEGLLSIDRKDLTEVAQAYYDTELAERGLLPDTPEQVKDDAVLNPEEDLVVVATYLSLHEADLGRALLQSADIPARLENEISSSWTGAGGLRLTVPASFVEQAEEILEAPISDEDLLAQAEAADPIDSAHEDGTD